MRTGKQRAGRLVSKPISDQDVIRRIFYEFATGYRRVTLSEIATGLNLDSIPTARGGSWHPSTVRYVLSNSVYAGTVVTEDMFATAQARLQALRRGPPK